MTTFARRNLNGHVLTTFCMRTPDNDLKRIAELAEHAQDTTNDTPIFVEIGSWVGESAIAMHLGAPHAIIHCVDTWEGSARDTSGDFLKYLPENTTLFDIFFENTQSVAKNTFIPHIGFSQQIAQSFNKKADLIFIDAEHDYEDVKQDIQAWLPHLKNTGIIAGHDYGETFPGVALAVQEFAQNCGKTVWAPPESCVWAVFEPKK